MPRVTVNGVELYFEIRGAGSPVLLIMGATGDGGHLDAFADLLADEFMVVSYDRRGNGRSPVPSSWQTTSPEEQADAAALLDALGTGTAAVFGTSSGGNFALCLMLRHPGSVRGAILHEPGLYALVDDFDAVRVPVRALVEEAMEVGGPPAAVERSGATWPETNAWDWLSPALRERLRATASTLFDVELGTYELYLPDEETLAALSAPVRPLVSEDGLPVFAEIAGRFGKRLGVDVAATPGMRTENEADMLRARIQGFSVAYERAAGDRCWFCSVARVSLRFTCMEATARRALDPVHGDRLARASAVQGARRGPARVAPGSWHDVVLVEIEVPGTLCHDCRKWTGVIL